MRERIHTCTCVHLFVLAYSQACTYKWTCMCVNTKALMTLNLTDVHILGGSVSMTMMAKGTITLSASEINTSKEHCDFNN